MSVPHDSLKALARKLADNLSQEPGVHFPDREVIARRIMDAIQKANELGELPYLSTDETFEDNPFNRQRLEGQAYGKFEVMGVDQDFWEAVENFLQIGKRYRITIQELP